MLKRAKLIIDENVTKKENNEEQLDVFLWNRILIRLKVEQSKNNNTFFFFLFTIICRKIFGWLQFENFYV